MNRNLDRPTASTREPKTNGGDRVVRTLRVYESGRVVPLPGRPPRNWAAIVTRARAHALPADGPSPAPSEIRQEPAAKVKNPAKVAAGKARAAQAAARKAEAAKVAAPAPTPAKKAPAKKAAAKAPSKAKAKPAAKAKAKPAKKAPAKRGGARAGSGPKPKAGDAMVVAAFRVTKAQKAKLGKLGAEWLRARIDAATVK